MHHWFAFWLFRTMWFHGCLKFKVVNTCASRTQAWLINLRWCCALLNRTWSCCACYAVLAAGSCRPILPVLLLCSPSYTETFKNQDIVHERRNTKLQVHIYGLLCLGEASLKHCSLNPSHHMFMSVVSSTARSDPGSRTWIRTWSILKVRIWCLIFIHLFAYY